MKPLSKIVLGVDPGITYSGFGLVEVYGNKLIHVGSGTIGSPKTSPNIPDRIKLNYEKLAEIIQRFAPAEMVLEKIFYAKNVRMAIELAHIRGALILAAKVNNLPVYEYSALEIKQAVVGYGRGSKSQVHVMVKKLLRNPPLKDSHSADALAAAICHCHSFSLSRRISDIFSS